jgi:ribosomal protein L22
MKERKAMKKSETEKKKPVEISKEKKVENKEETKKRNEKKPTEKQLDKPKKTEVVVNGRSLPISTKKSVAVCTFIRYKKIPVAISDLERVLVHKKVVPMKGEIPHQKGKGISSGGYPKNATEHFITLLKSLQANANANGLNEPVISEAIANLASRPHGKFGRVRKKRTHVKIVAKEKKK